MNKDDILSAIEDVLDSSELPMKEYKATIVRENGDSHLDICRIDNNGYIPHMYLFSEIFNSYSQNWYVIIIESLIHIIVK